MCAEKNNDKSGKSTASGCCDGMAEMMKNCCPDGAGDFECFAKMKEMKDEMKCKFNVTGDKSGNN